MRRSVWKFGLWIVGAGVLFTTTFLLLNSEFRDPSDGQKTEETSDSPPAVESPSEVGTSREPTGISPKPEEVVVGIVEYQKRLEDTQGENRFVVLADLKENLSRMPSREASERIRNYLATGEDFDLGFPFAVGPGGNLEVGDTLRVNLLDWLGQIDPVRAAEVSQTIYQSMESPEEWAVSLRNTVWGGREQDQEWQAREEVRSRIVEMMEHEPWRENPSAGYLEAMDAVVYSRSPEAVMVLMENLAPDSPDYLAAATRRALNHLAETDGLLLIEAMEANEWKNIDSREKAWFHSKLADPSAEAQELLKSYVAKADREEAEDFLRLYPNFSRGYSYTLLTPFHTTRGATFSQLEQFAQMDLAPLISFEKETN